MLKLEGDVPQAVGEAAAAFARVGCGYLFPENRGIQAQISLQALPIHSIGQVTREALRPENLRRVGWRFFVFASNHLVALVSAKEGPTPCATSFDPVREGDPLFSAIRIVDRAIDRDGEHGIRFVEIADIHASFFWVTGREPVFVDTVRPRVFAHAAFIGELQRRWDLKRRGPFGPDPEPGQEPEPSPEDDAPSLGGPVGPRQ